MSGHGSRGCFTYRGYKLDGRSGSDRCDHTNVLCPPINRVEEISSPPLVSQGSVDPVVPPAHSDRFVTRGCAVWHVQSQQPATDRDDVSPVPTTSNTGCGTGLDLRR